MIFAVKLCMTLATLAFAFGYSLRHRNNPMHRQVMLVGFGLTVAIAVVLVVGVQGFGAGYRPAFWLIEWLGETGARRVLLVHRAIATVTFLLLATQVYTGARRLPLHAALYPFTVLAWLVAYVSGMFIFV